MATKAEIIEAIRRGEDRVIATFSALSPEQLATRVHDDEGDQWTAKHVLAHLAGRAEGYQRLLQRAQGAQAAPAQATSQPAGGGFNVDEWNRRQVSPRVDRPVDALLEEFRRVHEDLVRQVEALPDDLLARMVPYPPPERPLGDVIMRSGGTHSINHTAVVEQALGLPEGGGA
jgi:hypothetical protein